ncbi:GntR family transcriptional regulator [Microbulbifer sp. ZKSA006]|uniref:GntR family transcriptional regulator n=1 Tax=Microbulbifer sp. ZKSA006 TaxID=3243390 RepID=UPI0040396FB5
MEYQCTYCRRVDSNKKVNDRNTINRVYNDIKECIITGQIPPGNRLNIDMLAEQFRVSTTPVREILNRLSAEDIIVMVPRMGFFMKNLIEPDILDLYELNYILLEKSIEIILNRKVKNEESSLSFRSITNTGVQHENLCNNHLIRSFEKLMLDLARQSGNNQIELNINNINNRLHYIRVCECGTQDNYREDISLILSLYGDDKIEELRDYLRTFYKSRIDFLPGTLREISYQQKNDRETVPSLPLNNNNYETREVVNYSV